jgi:dTMP kinase
MGTIPCGPPPWFRPTLTLFVFSPLALSAMVAPPAPFIAVDGIDGVGKSTQIGRLRETLQNRGLACHITQDPGSTPVGMQLRRLLLDSELVMHRRTEAMLFMASRCEMVETVIRPTLQSGTVVISDRFLLANVVYQSVGSTGADPSLLWRLGELANAGLRPDLTLLLDMPAEAAMRRRTRGADRVESRGLDYLRRVRAAFRDQLPRASKHTAVIDADGEVDAVAGEISRVVHAFLDEFERH